MAENKQKNFSNLIIDARTGLFAILQQSSHRHVLRMDGIGFHIVHRVEFAVKRNVKVLGRIGIQAHFYPADERYLRGQRFNAFLKGGHHFRFPSGFHLRIQLKQYDMLYHLLCFLALSCKLNQFN